jgi:hypothetical protein
MRWTQDQVDAYNSRFSDSQKTDSHPDIGPESQLQARIEKYLKENGFYFFHDRSRGANKAGQPDLVIALHGGRTLWIELKAAKGRMDKNQRLTRQILLALGHEFYEIRSFKLFIQLLER